MIRFQAKLLRPIEGEGWLFFRLPKAASDQLSTRSMTSVEGTLNGIAFQTALKPDGEGGHWMKVEGELLRSGEFRSGVQVDVEMEQMLQEPEPEVPSDLQEALDAAPAAMAVWMDITPIARRDWIQWITSGKKAETRGIRIGKAMDMLAHGKRRACCFDRSGIYSKGFSCPVAAGD